METIYKSCSPKYSNEDIKRLSGTRTFASFERLLTTSLYDAIRKRPNEVIVGMSIDFDGIHVHLETDDDKTDESCYHPLTNRVKTHRGIHCGKCGKRF